MKRREFLTIAGVTGALSAIVSLKFFTTSFEEAAVRMIRNELNFLKLDPEGITRFAREYAKSRDSRYKLAIKGYSLLGIPSSRSGKVHQLVSHYLLSTDFFTNKMDEARTIRYTGLYDPYRKPCAHPFNHVQYSEATA